MAFGTLKIDKIQTSTQEALVDDLIAGNSSPGTVTSVDLDVPLGFQASGGPVTTSGSITLSYAAGYQGFTTAESSKLAGIEAGAQVNVGTNLIYTAATRLLSSSTGDDVTLPLFTSTLAGLAPASGGGTTNFLRADGTWAAPPIGGTGTVTSVALAAPTGFSVSGSPITESGTLALAYDTGYQGFTSAESSKLAGIATSANNYVHPNHSGDVTSDGDGATTISDGAVTLAKMEDRSGQVLIGRHSGGSGTPQEVSVGNGLEFQGSGIRRSALTGDVTAAAGSSDTTIANDAVNNAKLSDMPEGAIKARITAGTGDPEDATAEQIRTLLKVPSEGIGYALSLSTAELTAEADIQRHVMSAPGTITELRYQCPLAAPTGSALELDVLKNGVSILSPRLTIDVGEISSETAAVPAVISDASFEAGDVYTFSRTQGDAGATARGDRIFMFYQET